MRDAFSAAARRKAECALVDFAQERRGLNLTTSSFLVTYGARSSTKKSYGAILLEVSDEKIRCTIK